MWGDGGVQHSNKNMANDVKPLTRRVLEIFHHLPAVTAANGSKSQLIQRQDQTIILACELLDHNEVHCRHNPEFEVTSKQLVSKTPEVLFNLLDVKEILG